jgi:hypothetical protein
MVLHGFGKAETQVQFLLGAPILGITDGLNSTFSCLKKSKGIKYLLDEK